MILFNCDTIKSKKYRIAAIGSASESTPEKVFQRARRIGEILGEFEEVGALTCGGTTGTIKRVAERAKSRGLKTIGYTPALNLEEHRKFGLPVEPYSKLVYTSEYLKEDKIRKLDRMGRYKLRIPYLITNSDAVIAISGRVGTITEILNALDVKIPIGILKNSGGISEKIVEWIDYLADLKEMKYNVTYKGNPKELVHGILESLK